MLTLIQKVLQKPQAKEAGYYFGANLFKALVSIVIIPVHTHLLTPAQFGLWSIWSSVLTFFEQLVDMGQKSVIQKHFHTDENFPQTLSNTLMLLLLSAGVCLMALYGLTFWQTELFGLPTEYYLMVPVFALGTVLFLVNTVLLRHENKPLAFCLYQGGHVLGIAGMGVVFIWFWQASWLALMLGMGVTLLVITVLSLWRFAVRYKAYPRFNAAKIKALVLVGLPMIFYGMNTMIISLSDRLILAEIFDSATVGIYSAHYKIGMASHVLLYAVINTMIPWQYKQLKNLNDKSRLRLAQYAILFMLTMFIMAGFMMVLTPIAVTLFFDEAYHGMDGVLYWIVLAVMIQAWFGVYFHILIFYDAKRVFISVSVLASVAKIVLTIYAAYLIGPVGAAMATFAANTIILIGLFHASRRYIKLPYRKALKGLWQRGFHA